MSPSREHSCGLATDIQALFMSGKALRGCPFQGLVTPCREILTHVKGRWEFYSSSPYSLVSRPVHFIVYSGINTMLFHIIGTLFVVCQNIADIKAYSTIIAWGDNCAKNCSDILAEII